MLSLPIQCFLSLLFTIPIGCNPLPVQTIRPTASQAATLKNNYETRAPQYNDDSPLIALSLAELQLKKNPTPNPSPTPGPNPNVKIGDICPNCKGRGKLSYDGGGSWTDCTPCGKDGRVDEGDPILSGLSFSLPEKNQSQVQYYITYEGLDLFWDRTKKHFKDKTLSIIVTAFHITDISKEKTVEFCNPNGKCYILPIKQLKD